MIVSVIDIPINHIFMDEHGLLNASQSMIFWIIFTGDTQYYFHCTHDNIACWSMCNDGIECQKRQSRYANRLQIESISTFIATHHNVQAIVIDGDLTDYGHADQLNAFEVTPYSEYYN